MNPLLRLVLLLCVENRWSYSVEVSKRCVCGNASDSRQAILGFVVAEEEGTVRFPLALATLSPPTGGRQCSLPNPSTWQEKSIKWQEIAVPEATAFSRSMLGAHLPHLPALDLKNSDGDNDDYYGEDEFSVAMATHGRFLPHFGASSSFEYILFKPAVVESSSFELIIFGPNDGFRHHD